VAGRLITRVYADHEASMEWQRTLGLPRPDGAEEVDFRVSRSDEIHGRRHDRATERRSRNRLLGNDVRA
jgi:hypothetical protein